MRRLVAVAALPVIAGAVVVTVALASRQGSAQTTVPAHLTGEMTNSPPWPRNVDALRERLGELHLPALAAEGTVLHIHQHLDVFDNGKRVTVPAGIGIGDTFISPLHTHDTSGVVHVESPTIRPSPRARTSASAASIRCVPAPSPSCAGSTSVWTRTRASGRSR